MLFDDIKNPLQEAEKNLASADQRFAKLTREPHDEAVDVPVELAMITEDLYHAMRALYVQAGWARADHEKLAERIKVLEDKVSSKA